MNKILVTGANGFIGESLCKVLSDKNNLVRGVVRDISKIKKNSKIEYVSVGNINFETNWSKSLADIDYVVHCAGKAHIVNQNNKSPKEVYQSINVEGTRQLVTQAAKAGIKRLIFLSTIKVNGEITDDVEGIYNKKSKKIFTHMDKPSPKDPYGLSKWEAEKVLWEISTKTNLEICVLRLPLVYGKGVKGNLRRLINLMRFGLPLPFSLVKNKRSMIGLDNLVDLISCCIDHPAANGKTFLVSDGEDLSTTDLLSYIASSMGRTSRLFPVPIYLLKTAGFIFNREKEVNRLVESLKVDSRFTRDTLNWLPPVNVVEGIRRMVQ
jgi:nucleoside-diphosphate-sugar epimerase